MKTAIPVWIAFVPSSFALGVAAKAYDLHWGEIVLMSALVYAGPAQFAVLEPLGTGKPGWQILLTTLLVNLRFLPMSAAIAPYFRRASRRRLFFAAHFISASSFVLPYLHFQQEEKRLLAARSPTHGEGNLSFFLGLAVTSCSVWVAGTAMGYGAALSVPPGFEEGMKFILPGYFACLLATEVRGRTASLVCVFSLLAAVPGALWNPDWGWILSALVIATLASGFERWTRRA